jgi:signal transduction histidine kinase
MRILPRGLTGRTILVLLAAVSLVHAGSMLIYERALIRIVEPRSESDARQRLQAASDVLADRPIAERAAVAALLSSDNFHLSWTQDAQAAVGKLIDPRAGRLEPEGVVRLVDGSSLRYRLRVDDAAWHESHASLLSTSVMVGGVIIVAALLVRGIVAPLRRLASAADAIGHSADHAPIAERGPHEVRLVSRAFNAMQRRIARLILDRTQALAAVSHDLRTPITRLRLRAGFVADPEIQAAIDRDLDEMEAMVEATLAYVSGEQEAETPRPIDLPALLETLVDAETDLGHQASYDGPAHLTVLVRPLSLKRAFANLITNAVTYGGVARVRLRLEGRSPIITIDDDGPGIPEDDVKRVFDPFVRLEQSRNRGTGGVGLGLTIARRAVMAEGGALTLANRVGGGLSARVELPASVVAGRLTDRREIDAHAPPTRPVDDGADGRTVPGLGVPGPGHAHADRA